MSEKTKVLDRLFKAEARNLELEQTVKTLFTRIETLEAYKTTQGNGGTIHSIPNTEDKVSHDSTSSDKLIVGIRDKVTNYVLGKVDEELNKLLNNSGNISSNSEQFNSSQQSYDQQKSFVQPHQYSPNQHSIRNQPYVTTQHPNHQYPYYGQPVFHNTSHLQPSHQCSNAYYQYDHIQKREQDTEFIHSANLHPDVNYDRNICIENLIEILPNEQMNVNKTELSHSNESYRNDKEVVNNQQSIGKSDPNWFHISLEGAPISYEVMSKKVLITGASGLLGRAVYKEFVNEGSWEVLGLAFSRCTGKLRKCDITKDEEVKTVMKEFNPSVVIHSAAERKPDAVEKKPEATQQLNVSATKVICQNAVGDGNLMLQCTNHSWRWKRHATLHKSQLKVESGIRLSGPQSILENQY
ncbi:metK [Mytilus edulis]|uniref:Methionine adenosyltransferase 2 subunit beta n=1 Tax=Mytilus edulis TaxID=6550 RepID=A0A8S3UNE7_MYTED|nr:metK [Mytilus edulis]